MNKTSADDNQWRVLCRC